jgi:anti-sigma factor RsiW
VSKLLAFDARAAAGSDACGTAQEKFSEYLDGQMSGVEMAQVAAHLDGCAECAHQFSDWRAMQSVMAELGRVPAPARLQARLRGAIALEREQGTNLSWAGRGLKAWDRSVAPWAVRAAGGLAVALLLVGGLSWLFAAPLASVSANDDRMAHLTTPHYLYSQVPPTAIAARNDLPILVDAKVDAAGRVYDYAIVYGPTDAGVRLRVEENLLSSVFRPATVFGAPVRGHVMLTYMGVSVKG